MPVFVRLRDGVAEDSDIGDAPSASASKPHDLIGPHRRFAGTRAMTDDQKRARPDVLNRRGEAKPEVHPVGLGRAHDGEVVWGPLVEVGQECSRLCAPKRGEGSRGETTRGEGCRHQDGRGEGPRAPPPPPARLPLADRAMADVRDASFRLPRRAAYFPFTPPRLLAFLLTRAVLASKTKVKTLSFRLRP